MFPDLKRGDLVEFGYGDDDEAGDGTVAVFTGQRQGKALTVENADGKTVIHVSNVLAYGWAGWMPDNLENIWEQYNEHLNDEEGDFWED